MIVHVELACIDNVAILLLLLLLLIVVCGASAIQQSSGSPSEKCQAFQQPSLPSSSSSYSQSPYGLSGMV